MSSHINSITPALNPSDHSPLYLQLYDYIKSEIASGHMEGGTKLPSLRSLASSLKISITTVGLAYNQLSVEGYITSREKSGYYVNSDVEDPKVARYMAPVVRAIEVEQNDKPRLYTDSSLFDFVKWKKCLNHVINEHTDLLTFEASPQGEAYLREQISHYLYMTRGVVCTPDQIIIAAGTQQIINLACSFLLEMGFDSIAHEDPGYLPSISVFRDRGFKTLPIEVSESGVSLEQLKDLSPSVISVSPSIQFPMGTVMPVAQRNSLLNYAARNGCIIIEDDYASELRYFGRPVPPLKSMSGTAQVLYLGSFSSLLFPSLKISYMVLPPSMLPYSRTIMRNYNQTCSKTEQLALAVYMEKGLLQTHVKKMRNLYAQKIDLACDSIQKIFGNRITISSRDSGLNMLLKVRSEKSSEELCSLASEVGLNMVPMRQYQINKKDEDNHILIFYYSPVPIHDIRNAIEDLADVWSL